MILSCSVPNFKMIGQLKLILYKNEISRDLGVSFEWIFYFAQPPVT